MWSCFCFRSYSHCLCFLFKVSESFSDMYLRINLNTLSEIQLQTKIKYNRDDSLVCVYYRRKWIYLFNKNLWEGIRVKIIALIVIFRDFFFSPSPIVILIHKLSFDSPLPKLIPPIKICSINKIDKGTKYHIYELTSFQVWSNHL